MPATPAPDDAPAATTDAAAPAPGAEDRIAQLEQELAEQRALIQRQQAAIEALKTAPEPDADAEAAALMAELQSDGDAERAEELARQDPLQLYGYLDVGFGRLFIPDDLLIAGVVPTRESTFVLGNLNLYLDARPVDDWRGLAEVRFTNLPHGNEKSFEVPGVAAYQRKDRVDLNSTSPDGRDKVLMGSVIVERAWIQWEGEPLANVRVGQWLTPFGIWNVDHGTPVLISLLQPDFQILQRFPARQTGVQLLGESASGDWSLGYHFTVSNGRQAGLADPTDDKALGARLHATYLGDLTAKVGLSGYWGSLYDFKKVLDPASGEIAWETTVDGSEWVLGTDLSLDIDALRIRAELVLSHVEFEPGKRAPVAFAAPGSETPDHYYTNAYVTTAYKLGSLEPLLYAEITHKPASLGDTSIITGPGVNVYFTPTVQLKTMVALVTLDDFVGEDTSPQRENRFVSAISRLVLAF